MQSKSPERVLRTVLFVDAATCLGCGLVMALAARPLASATELPSDLLTYAGLSLLPIALFMAFVGARALRSTLLVGIVIAGNVLWTLASMLLLVSGLIAPNVLGHAFVVAQALVVLALTLLEVKSASARWRSPALRTA